MALSTTTVFAGIPRSDMLEAYVCVRARDIGEEFPTLVTCRVAIEAPDHRSPHHVRLAVATAGDAIFAGASAGAGGGSGDLYMLVDRAFERMHAQLGARARRETARASGPSLVRTVVDRAQLEFAPSAALAK